MSSPKYARPDQQQLRDSLSGTSKHATVARPRLIALDIKRIVPREQIILEDELVDAMLDAPEEIPPIVVAPWGDVHVVVDGHHRLAAALQAGLKWIWVIEVDLVKLKTLRWPEWY